MHLVYPPPPPPPPQFCITNNHWQKKCERFGKGKQDALWLMWKWWIGLLMVETSFYPHKYNFSCWRLSWLSGRSGSPDVDHVDERFFPPCEKQLSRLWEKQIGSSHLDVWKIESKITLSVWWREGSRNRDSTVYNITFEWLVWTLKTFFVLGSSGKYLLDDSQQPHQRACALGSEPIQAKGWLCHSFNAWKTHKLWALYRETNSWELWSKICGYRIGCPVFLDHHWKHVLFNG